MKRTRDRAVDMVRRIRDRQAKALAGKSAAEVIAFYRAADNGIRVTPNIYTPLEEIDTFVMAMEDLLKNGLPATA